MAATKLRLYNDAIRHLGDARLALITDDVETRYSLDDSWDEAVAFTLRQAPWRFALKQVALGVGGTAVGGYVLSYAFPADWLRTHAVFQLDARKRECPFDLRETGNSLSVGVIAASPVYMRYVSNTYTDPAAFAWPEHFAQCVAAYLAFLVAEKVTGDRAAPGRMSQLFASLLPEAVSVDGIAEDPWLPHQRSGAFLRVARATADEGLWRFALVEASISTSAGAGDGGLAHKYAVPTDWSRTRSLYQVSTTGQRRPFDVRERAGFWHTNETTFYAEYVSTTKAMDSTLWPDHYMRAVLRQLEFEVASVADKDRQQDGIAWKDALAAAMDGESEPDDPWFYYQTSGALARCIPAVMSKGYWRFALKTALFNAESDQEAVTAPDQYPYRFTIPSDWFKTHALFVPWDGAECPFDIKEHEGKWSTATKSWMAQYITTAALVPANWPDSVAKAVLAYLDFETAKPEQKKEAADIWAEAIGAALTEWSLPEHPWLRFQLDGRYFEAVKFCLGMARWRFAIKTKVFTANATMNADGTVSGTVIPTGLGDGSISPSYSAVFTKPADWYRTLWMYRVITGGPQVNVGYVTREDIDYRDEGGNWHTNWDTIQVRYLSRDGLDSTKCPPSFRNAVLAWLEYEEVRGNPKLAGVAATKLKLWDDLKQRAEEEDDTREQPPVLAAGRFVRSRYRNGFANGSSGAGGATPAPSSTEVILVDSEGAAVSDGSAVSASG